MTINSRASTTRDNSILHHSDADAPFRASRQVSPELARECFELVAGDTDPELIDAKANVTWRALRYRWPRYERWCESAGRTPLPCDAEQLRAYVRALMSQSMAPATIAAYVAAVGTVARLRGSFVDRRLIGEHLKAARRRHGAPRRARPARGTDVAGIFAQCRPEAVRDVRDAVVFALGFGLAGRASELVGLDWERAGSVGSTGVVQLDGRGILVRWHRTKSSQDREIELEIPDADMPEARAWLERWISLAVIRSGTPLLRPLTKWGTIVSARLSTAAISMIIRRRVELLEIGRGHSPDEARQRAARFSSHSLRRGFCTSAAEAGAPLNVIRHRSRHADDGMVARYVGEAEGRRHSGLAGLVPARSSDHER